MVKEVGAEDRPLDLCYYKYPRQGTSQSKVEGERTPAECVDFGAVGSFEVEVGLGELSIGSYGWQHTDGRASVNEEGEVVGGIVDV